MNRVDTKIGNRIKSVREAKKMTVEDIKKETGLSKSYLKEIENDDDTPNLGNVSKISKVLGIRTGTFLDGEEDLSPVVSSLKSRRRVNGIRGIVDLNVIY
jgi:transcriptional regulator with XRE-family HTH domain